MEEAALKDAALTIRVVTRETEATLPALLEAAEREPLKTLVLVVEERDVTLAERVDALIDQFGSKPPAIRIANSKGLIVRSKPKKGLRGGGDPPPVLSVRTVEERLELISGPVTGSVRFTLPSGMGADWAGVKSPSLRGALISIIDAFRAAPLSREEFDRIQTLARRIAFQA